MGDHHQNCRESHTVKMLVKDFMSDFLSISSVKVCFQPKTRNFDLKQRCLMKSFSQVIFNRHLPKGEANFENLHVSMVFWEKWSSQLRDWSVNQFLLVDVFSREPTSLNGELKQLQWKLILEKKTCFNSFLVDVHRFLLRCCCFYDLKVLFSSKTLTRSPPFPHTAMSWNPQVPSADVHPWRNLAQRAAPEKSTRIGKPCKQKHYNRLLMEEILHHLECIKPCK